MNDKDTLDAIRRDEATRQAVRDKAEKKKLGLGCLFVILLLIFCTLLILV